MRERETNERKEQTKKKQRTCKASIENKLHRKNVTKAT